MIENLVPFESKFCKHKFSTLETPNKNAVRMELQYMILNNEYIDLEKILQNLKNRKVINSIDRRLLKIQIFDENRKIMLNPINVSVDLSKENWYENLCKRLFTKKILDSDFKEVYNDEIMNKKLYCFSKLPENFSLHHSLIVKDEKLRMKWESKFRKHFIKILCETIASFNSKNIRDTINSLNSAFFERFFEVEIENIDLYDHLSSKFKDESQPFNALCNMCGINYFEEYEKLRDFYIGDIPLFLLLNMNNYHQMLKHAYQEKSKMQYKKMLTSQEKMDFWEQQITKFYEMKSKLKSNKPQCIIEEFNKQNEKKEINYYFNNSQDLIYQKTKVPLSMQYYLDEDYIDHSCKKTKMSFLRNKLKCSELLSDRTKEFNDMDKIEDGRTFVFLPKEGFDKKKHVIHVKDSNFKWNKNQFHFNNGYENYSFDPFDNTLKLQNEDIQIKVDEHLENDILYLIE